MSTPDEAKSALRREIKSRLASMSPEERAKGSEQACSRISELEEYSHASTVMLYLAFGTELDVDSLVRRGLQDAKRIVVPRVDWPSLTMDVVELTSLDDDALTVDERGIRTPRGRTSVTTGEVDLIVTPGLAFDTLGRRLGRSGGFYDRFMEGLPSSVVRVGVAFERQIVDRVPTEDHDQRIAIVATDDRLVRVQG